MSRTPVSQATRSRGPGACVILDAALGRTAELLRELQRVPLANLPPRILAAEREFYDLTDSHPVFDRIGEAVQAAGLYDDDFPQHPPPDEPGDRWDGLS